MTDNDEPITLKGEEALELWHKGMEAWNQWVKKHPKATVYFHRVDFSEHNSPSWPHVNFHQYRFPDGGVNFDYSDFSLAENVSFSLADFGEGHVSFNDVHFGTGKVDFCGAKFGDDSIGFINAIFGKGGTDFSNVRIGGGDVNFYGAYFGEAGTTFQEASFGEGSVSFREAKFSGGKVDFSKASFGEGDVSFDRATFSNGNVSFDHATFGDGNVSFNGAIFVNVNASFLNVNFGDGNAYFNDATFGNGGISFDNATFGDGAVWFKGATFGKENLDFNQAYFKGHISFYSIKNAELIKSFSFRHAIFEKSLDLSDNTFNCVVDLTNTKMANQVSLESVKCLVTKATTDKSDIARLRRLKEIAESNKSHQQALAFHADEMKAMRWHELGRAASALDWLYEKTSNYGQSILRPAILLVVVAVCFALLYLLLSGSLNLNSDFDLNTLISAVNLTFANALPFLPPAKPIITSSLNALFQTRETGNIQAWYNLASLLQSFVMFVLLFLIGLGIRNRFRI